MGIQAPEKFSLDLFLDRRESGVLHFVKYHGLGNDFILFDNRDSVEPKITLEQAKKFYDRNFGIGANGVIFALRCINGTDFTMRIFNSYGSEPEMSKLGKDAESLIKKLNTSKEGDPMSPRKLAAKYREKPAKHISLECIPRFI